MAGGTSIPLNKENLNKIYCKLILFLVYSSQVRTIPFGQFEGCRK